MKNFIVLLMSFLAAASLAQGETIQQDGISYEILTTNPATCRVIGSNSDWTGPVVIPATVTSSGGLTYTVTEIGEAFNFCEGLTSVSIPETVTSIGMAFCRCPGLTEIVIPNSVTTINNGIRFNENLKEVTIGKSVTALNNTFQSCPSLRKVFSKPMVPPGGYPFREMSLDRCILYVPDGCKDAYVSQFSGCGFGKIIEADMSAGTAGLHSYDFADGGFFFDIISEADRTCALTWDDTDYEVPSGHLVIPSKAVNGNTTYTVTEIDGNTFNGVKGVVELTLPASIRKIGEKAFGLYWSGMVNPSRVYALGTTPPEGDALHGTRHSALFVPFGAKEAWRNWGSYNRIKEADMSSGDLSGILSCDFISGGVCYVVISEADRTCAASWPDKPYTFNGKLDIPETVVNVGKSYKVTHIEYDAFKGCSGISELVLPQTLDSIGMSAFAECTALTAVSIPDNVSFIDYLTFSGCSALESVTLGKKLKALNSSFSKCPAVRLIRNFSHEPPMVYNSDFDAIVFDEARVLVPPAYVDRYRNDGYAPEYGWCIFKNIEADPEQTDTRVLVDGIMYDFTDNGAVVVPGGTPYAGRVSIPEKITIEGTEYPVTCIGTGAFDGCGSLTELVIPASVKALEYGSIRNCPSLTKLTIADGPTPLNRERNNQGQYGTPFEGCPLTSIYLGRATDWNLSSFNQLTDLAFGSSLTRVSGFNNCSSLTEVKFPASVTEINGFDYCGALKSVILPASLRTISGFSSSALTSLKLPQSVVTVTGFNDSPIESLELNAGLDSICGFNRTKITTLSLPASLRSVNGFSYTGLTTIALPESLKRVCGFDGIKVQTVTLPASLQYVGGFNYCENLTSVEIPDNVVDVASAFCDCAAIETVRIGKKVGYIDSSFRIYDSNTSSSLREIVIGSSVRFISEDCFLTRDNAAPTVEKIWMLPSTPPLAGVLPFVRGLGENTLVYVPLGALQAYRSNDNFANCNLVEMDLSNMEVYDCNADGVFVDITSEDNTTCTVTSGDNDYSGDVEIPETVTFMGQTYTVTVVGTDAFADNTELTGVNVPSTVTTICSGAFSGCTSLANVTLGESVAVIAYDAFAGSSAITEIHSQNPEPPAVEIMARSAADLFEPEVYAGATLYVPLGTSAAYKSAPAWSRFATIAEEASGINSVNADMKGVDVRVDGGRILASGIEPGTPIMLHSVDGRVIAYSAHNDGLAVLEVKSPGIYILRIGSATVKVRI